MPTYTLMRRIRKERGRTLQSLAAECGTTHATIRNYECGLIREGRPSVRAAIEKALGVPIEILLMPEAESAPVREDESAEVATQPVHPYSHEGGKVDAW